VPFKSRGKKKPLEERAATSITSQEGEVEIAERKANTEKNAGTVVGDLKTCMVGRTPRKHISLGS